MLELAADTSDTVKTQLVAAELEALGHAEMLTHIPIGGGHELRK
jgi:hypothetical protein